MVASNSCLSLYKYLTGSTSSLYFQSQKVPIDGVGRRLHSASVSQVFGLPISAVVAYRIYLFKVYLDSDLVAILTSFRNIRFESFSNSLKMALGVVDIVEVFFILRRCLKNLPLYKYMTKVIHENNPAS